MVNTKKLKARIAEQGMTQKEVAKALNLAPATISQKINNVRPMYLKEADKLADLLKIKCFEFGEYFFTSKIA